MTSPVIAIIGAGNMGSSLIGGLIKTGHPSKKIWATAASEETLTILRENFKINTTTDNLKAVQAAEVIIFAVKPQAFGKIAAEISEVLQTHHPLIISIAAGVPTITIQKWLGGKVAVVRCMPNTPALINCGATALFASSLVTSEQRNIAESILRAVGVVVWLSDEKWMDIVTALSGSGPAYFFHMMEALQMAAEELGLPTETARLLTLQTALGAARMAIESGKPIAELRKNVTSPGGTTEKALSVLEENNIRGLYKMALHAAKRRSEELASLLGDN